MKTNRMVSKRLISALLTLAMLATLLPTGLFAIPSSAAEECIEYSGTNINIEAHDCSWSWATPIDSYLTETANGQLMRVQANAIDDAYLIEYYDSDYNILSTSMIAEELPLFGGFYATETNYYILSGQTNLEESADVECFRITKYDLNWKRIASTGIYDCDTTTPFRAACARFAMIGDTMYIHTGHEMYADSNGVNHQSNFTIVVDTVKMTAKSEQLFYVSHSFNQFILADGSNIATLDHGDAYPSRSIILNSTNSYDRINVLDFPGEKGDNFTGASIGGFEMTDSTYLVAYNSVDHDDNYQHNRTQNIYVASIDKSLSSVEIKQITNRPEGRETFTTPQFVKLSNSEFMILWSETRSMFNEAQNVYYMTLDGNGNPTSEIYRIDDANLSDCKPIVKDGKVVWYGYRGMVTTFYEIDADTPSDYRISVTEGGHNYDITYPSEIGGICTVKCKICGLDKSFPTSRSFTTYWGEGEFCYCVGGPPTQYTVGEKVEIWFEEDDPTVVNSEKIYTVSDPEAILCVSPNAGARGTLYFKKPGKYKVTVTDKFNPDLSYTYTLNIVLPEADVVVNNECTHGYEKTVVLPTCLEQGYTTYICNICCDFYLSDYVDATGHDYRSVVTAPTCSEYGYTTYTCSRCSDSYIGDYTYMINHDLQITTRPTQLGGDCAVQCSNCGYTETFLTAIGILTYWNEDGSDKYYTPLEKFKFKTGDQLYLMICIKSYGYLAYTQQIVTVSDSDGITYTETGDNIGYFTFNKSGNYTITVTDKYNPLVTESVNVTVVDPSATLPGDVDGSGAFDLLDVLLMQQYLSGWDVELDTDAGDVNDDGETNLLDVLLMQQSLAGWDVELQ